MKVSSASVRLYLRTTKKLANGGYAVMLRVSFHGMKEISTGVSVRVSDWDKRNESIKKSVPNYLSLNRQLSSLKSRAISIRDSYESQGIQYTSSMIIDILKNGDNSNNSIKVRNTNLSSIVNEYIEVKCLSKGSIDSWNSVISNFKLYKGDVEITSIDSYMMMGFAKYLENERRVSDGYIRLLLSKLHALNDYCIENGIVSNSWFKGFNFRKKYSASSRLQSIHWKTIDVMKQYYLDHYSDDDLTNKSTVGFAAMFWFMGYYFQGLSPIDLAMVRKLDLSLIKFDDGHSYIQYYTKRRKTNMSVSCMIRYDDELFSLFYDKLIFSDGEWLLPLLNGLKYDEIDNIRKRMKCLFEMSIKLRYFFNAVNQYIEENDIDVPMIDLDNSYYSYRHSFAMSYMQHGGNPIALATLMGRSPNTIATYVSELTEASDLKEAVDILYK